VVVKGAGHEIWGYCDLPKMTNSSVEETPANIKRLILKTDSQTSEDISVKLKRSLIRKC